MYYLISSNASHLIHLFLAQWRHISSESAVNVTGITGNCAINAQTASRLNSSFSDSFNVISGFTSNSRAQEAL